MRCQRPVGPPRSCGAAAADAPTSRFALCPEGDPALHHTAADVDHQHSRAYPPSMQGKKTAIAGAAIALAGCGGSSQTAVTLTSTLEITKTVVVTAPPPSIAPKTTMETDGTYRVGIDIVPGTYRTAGPRPHGESDCYWARLDRLDPDHIINNEISTDPQVVTIQPSDAAFLTHSCQPWQKAD